MLGFKKLKLDRLRGPALLRLMTLHVSSPLLTIGMWFWILNRFLPTAHCGIILVITEFIWFHRMVEPTQNNGRAQSTGITRFILLTVQYSAWHYWYQSPGLSFYWWALLPILVSIRVGFFDRWCSSHRLQNTLLWAVSRHRCYAWWPASIDYTCHQTPYLSLIYR